MGRLFERLLCDSNIAPPANPANIAPAVALGFADSQDSQGAAVSKTGEQRAHLLTLAADERLPAGAVHGLDDADVAACIGLPDTTLRAYLRVRDRGAVMDAAIVPPDYTQAALCRGRGPVWLWPGGPDRVFACPWCFRRKAGKAIPRPPVTCGSCRHYAPDPLNPSAGIGGCAKGLVSLWPMQARRCADWRAGDE